jgi:hypothetical protein
MSIEKKILQEIRRHHQINKYVTEQEVVPDVAPPILDPNAPPSTDPMAGGQTPPLGATDPMLPQEAPTPEIIDVSQDDEVEKIGSEGQTEETESGTEELEITDLVNAQKDIQSKQEEYFDRMFKQLDTLQSKVGEMDQLIDKINSLETKVEKYRPKTAQEKLELRSLDSGPFNQKLTDFFDEKEEDLEKSGKNEYILTSDEVENIVPSEVKKSFDITLPTPDTNFRSYY